MSDARADDAIIAGFVSALAACALLECVRDATGRITDFVVVAVNPSAERLIERPSADVVGGSVRAVPAFAGLHDSAEYAAVFETGKPLVDEFRVARGGDAPPCWVHRLVTRTPTGVMVVVRDISDDVNLRRSGDAFFQMSDD